ncbi:MAG: PAS domain S-box protein [Desulfuromonadales bacterium]|jgi:PAS domain S-box-containing protein
MNRKAVKLSTKGNGTTEDGHRYQRIYMFSDITERKHAEEELRKSEAHLQSVFRAAPIGVGVVVDRMFKQVNKRMCEITGYSNEELVGQNARMLYTCDDDYEHVGREKYRQIRDFGTGTVETRWKCKVGNIIDVLLSSTPIDMGGPSEEVVFTALDITERKRFEEELAEHHEQLETIIEDRTRELKEAQSELIQSERLATLGRVTATVSHELRNPLGTIQSSLFSIDDSIEKNEPHKARRSLELAERSINRCVKIIEELNSYARVKKLDVSKASVDNWLKAVFEEQSIPEGISSALDLASGVEATFDREKLRQAVVNLITNAVHSLQDKETERKHLRISTCLLDGKYEIRFEDNGVGMSDDVKERLFEPLFSTKEFGVGLGMVIVKTIVEKHYGKINIESKKGEGTTVILRLPINLQDERKAS